MCKNLNEATGQVAAEQLMAPPTDGVNFPAQRTCDGCQRKDCPFAKKGPKGTRE